MDWYEGPLHACDYQFRCAKMWISVIQEDRILMEEDWEESIAPLSLHHAKEFPAAWFTLAHYLAAKTLVSSRAFQVDDYHGYGMVPLADLFNHKTAGEDVHITSSGSSDSQSDSNSDSHSDPDSEQRSNARLSCGAFQGENGADNMEGKRTFSEVGEPPNHIEEPDASPSQSRRPSDDDSLEMILVKDVLAGSEIFNTYGTLGNAALLHRYGFTEPNNPFDIVNIDMDSVLDVMMKSFSSRHIRRRISFWKKAGCAPCVSQDCEYFEISVSGEPQDDLLTLLFLAHLPAETFDSLSRLETTIWQDGGRGGIEATARALGWPGPSHSKKKRKQQRAIDQNQEFDNVEMRRWLLTAPVRQSVHQLLEIRDGLYPTLSLEKDSSQLSMTCHTKQPKLYHALTLRFSERSILKRCHAFVSQC